MEYNDSIWQNSSYVPDYDNYEYVIASLPALTPDNRSITPQQADELIGEIRQSLKAADRKLLDLLLASYTEEGPREQYYREALGCKSRFLRRFSRFDLDLRNAKTAYLNEALGREPGLDLVLADAEEGGDCEDGERLRNILHDSDILRRERNLDDLCWEKIDELTGMEVFSLDCILGFVVKLKIIERWTALDPQTGREMFRKLVDEIRKTR